MISREQWLNERSKGITGTGASAIMGASPYMTNVDYWLEKTGQAVENIRIATEKSGPEDWQ